MMSEWKYLWWGLVDGCNIPTSWWKLVDEFSSDGLLAASNTARLAIASYTYSAAALAEH